MGMMFGYVKFRKQTPYKCGVCKKEIRGGLAEITRLSDNVKMCYSCYVKECKKSRKDKSKCLCRTCPYNGQTMCEHIHLSRENGALRARVSELERKARKQAKSKKI